MALAIQNLAWGIGRPIFWAITEKLEDRRNIVIGVVTHAIGMILYVGTVSPIEHQFCEISISFSVAGTGFGLVVAVVGRLSSNENRIMSVAIATVAGSGVQVFGPLVAA